MALFFDLLDQSKQCNRASQNSLDQLPFHAPNNKYKITHHALIIPNLPAPLHYFNFYSLLGQPNALALQNESSINTSPLDTATVFNSVSGKMAGCLHSYSMEKDCSFLQNQFQFSDCERIQGEFPNFQIEREDAELSFKIKITATNTVSHFIKLRMTLAEHWSLLCRCEGEIIYQKQKIEINHLGTFDFARTINFPYIPFAFYSYQIVNLKNDRQLICIQIRNEINEILQSRIYLRDGIKQTTQMFDESVEFNIYRIYPQITTPNGHQMYLPREFEWKHINKDGIQIILTAQSRGDFKFGLGAGYVGSFNYSVNINNDEEIGEGGYCEYIDCRALRWQEQNKEDKNIKNTANFVPFLTKR